MILQAEHEVEKLVSTDKTRSIIASANLEGDKLVVTNGRVLAAIKVEREAGDADGPVTVEALKSARKSGRKLGMVALKANGALVDTLSGTTFARPDLGSYPNWTALIPATDRKEFVIRLNADLLAALAAALGADGAVKLRIAVNKDGTAKMDPIKVEALVGKGAKKPENLGLLMPMGPAVGEPS